MVDTEHEAAVAAEADASPAAHDTKPRGTKRHQEKPELQQDASHAASKRPRRGAAAAEATDTDQQAGSSKSAAASNDKKRTRADDKPAAAEPAAAAAEGSKRQTRVAAPAAGKAAAAGAADTPQGQELVGCRNKVWWTDDKKFYSGTVKVCSTWKLVLSVFRCLLRRKQDACCAYLSVATRKL
jgi:hypothetical protein